MSVKCESCGSSDDIQFHHMDGNRNHNWWENKMVLCRNCHMALHSIIRKVFGEKGTIDPKMIRGRSNIHEILMEINGEYRKTFEGYACIGKPINPKVIEENLKALMRYDREDI